MLPVAFAPPAWATALRALRRLARTAVTVLVLVVGAGGLAAVPASTGLLRPVAAARVTVDLGQRPAVDLGQHSTGPAVDLGQHPTAADRRCAVAVPHLTVVGADVGQRLTAPPGTGSGQPRAASTAPGVPSQHLDRAAASPPADTAVAGPPAAPARDSVGRRGPPRA